MFKYETQGLLGEREEESEGILTVTRGDKTAGREVHKTIFSYLKNISKVLPQLNCVFKNVLNRTIRKFQSVTFLHLSSLLQVT
jgi:hypothetical protein